MLCVEHDGKVLRLAGFALESRWPSYEAVVERALASVAPLTDPVALSVQPQRLEIVKLDHRTTLAELARARPAPVPVATLVLLNQVEPETSLEAARLVKWIRGQAAR